MEDYFCLITVVLFFSNFLKIFVYNNCTKGVFIECKEQ